MHIFYTRHLLVSIKWLAAAILLLPLSVNAFYVKGDGFSATVIGEIINPDRWFDTLKQNITIPVSGQENLNIPIPQEALKSASPKLAEINKEIQEEVGIDFAKFFGWLAKILKIFFQFIISLIESLSKALGTQ